MYARRRYLPVVARHCCCIIHDVRFSPRVLQDEAFGIPHTCSCWHGSWRLIAEVEDSFSGIVWQYVNAEQGDNVSINLYLCLDLVIFIQECFYLSYLQLLKLYFIFTGLSVKSILNYQNEVNIDMVCPGSLWIYFQELYF